MPELRELPASETLMQSDALADLVEVLGAATVKTRLREMQRQMRATREVPVWATAAEGYASAMDTADAKPDYVPVFNLTGTVIHTKLGRALFSPALCLAIEPLMTRPMN